MFAPANFRSAPTANVPEISWAFTSFTDAVDRKLLMQLYSPLYAVQRLASGQWLVRAPVDDPLLPATFVVDVVDSGQIAA